MKRIIIATAVLLAGFVVFGAILLFYLPSSKSTTREVLGPYISWLDDHSAEIILCTKHNQEVDLVLKSATPGGAMVGRSHWTHAGIHQFTADGLQADTAYVYEISGGGADGEYVIRTAPTARKDFTFIAYGDSQNDTSSHRHHALTMNFGRHRPDFVISTGDLLQGVSKKGSDIFGEDWVVNVFDTVPQEFFATIPFFRTIGNHDIESDIKESVFFNVFPKLKDYMYEFVWGDAQFLCLYLPESVLGYDEKQRTWLREKVKSRPDARWRIAYFHVPPWAGGKHGQNPLAYGGREKLLADLVEAKVDLVFNGHEHAYERTRPLIPDGAAGNPVVFVVTGLAGVTAYKIDPQPYLSKIVTGSDHFCVVDVAENTLRLTAYDSKDQSIDQYEIRKDAVGKNSFADAALPVKRP